MSRGRLINIMTAGFQRQDVVSTVQDPVYNEPVVDRVDLPVNELPCQVEEPSWFRATFKPGGLEQDGEITIILHYADLEASGLIDANGTPLINIGTRLNYVRRTLGPIIQQWPEGVYVVQARDSSFGLSVDADPTRNLLILLLAPRAKAVS